MKQMKEALLSHPERGRRKELTNKEEAATIRWSITRKRKEEMINTKALEADIADNKPVTTEKMILRINTADTDRAIAVVQLIHLNRIATALEEANNREK